MFKKSKRSQIRQRARNHSESEDESSKNCGGTLPGQTSQETKPASSKTGRNLPSNENSQSNDSSSNSIHSNGQSQSVNLISKKASKLSFLHADDECNEEGMSFRQLNCHQLPIPHFNHLFIYIDVDAFKVKKSIYSKRMERNKKKKLKGFNSTVVQNKLPAKANDTSLKAEGPSRGKLSLMFCVFSVFKTY